MKSDAITRNARASAFPRTNFYGLNKREYFAAMAMQGLLSSDSKGFTEYEDCAKHAVAFAEALLVALGAPEYIV